MAQSEKIAPLEGLRAIAVALVVVNHTLPIPKETRDYFSWWAPGPDGVRLFFVLSGFLITGILLRARARDERPVAILRAFYVRRALRILPLASAAVLIAYVLDIQTMRVDWPWYVAYAINVRMAFAPEIRFGLSHFWSLAVEEQFYLFWPVLMLWLPRHRLAYAMYAMIAGAVLIRLALLLAGQPLAAYVLMPARLDALAAGGALAWQFERKRGVSPWLWLLGIGATAFGWSLSTDAWAYSWMEAGMVVISVMIIGTFSRMPYPAVARLIANPVFVYLGSVSYGIYVWHGFLPQLIRGIEEQTALSLHLPWSYGWPRLAYVSIVGVAAATASWYAFERPLNDLKRYFPYSGSARGADRSRTTPQPGLDIDTHPARADGAAEGR